MSATLKAPAAAAMRTCPARAVSRCSATRCKSIRPACTRALSAGAHEYGPYFRFRIGDRRFMGVADHEALAALMRDRPTACAAARSSSNLARAGARDRRVHCGRRCLAAPTAHVMAGFDPAHVREYFPSLQKVAHRLAGRWRVASAGRPGDRPAVHLMRFTVDAIAGLAFGSEVNTLESDSDRIQQHSTSLFPTLFKRIMAPLPTWRWFRSAADRQVEAASPK